VSEVPDLLAKHLTAKFLMFSVLIRNGLCTPFQQCIVSVVIVLAKLIGSSLAADSGRHLKHPAVICS